MKHQLFISYSDFDKDKVSLIVNELKNNKLFAPLIIASNREALKPLVKKVSEGIQKSLVIIPILSRKSMVTQWINQEIGYSMALEKPIRPIVEQEIISELKGFIHKQVDLPYNFITDKDQETENANFLKTFRDLISDLESEYSQSKTPSKAESDFEATLKLVDKHNSIKQFKKKRSEFLNSSEAIQESRNEVLRMIELIKSRIEILKEKDIIINTEEDQNKPLFVFKSKGYSCSFSWSMRYINTIDEATLCVKYWKGHFTSDRSVSFFPGDEPQQENVQVFSFDVDSNFNFVWIENEIEKSTKKIVDEAFKWLISSISKTSR